MSDYAKYGKAYYEANKESILAKEKENKRWVDYYAKNRETIAEKNRCRYYEKKGLPVPEKGKKERKERVKPPVPDTAMITRFEQLVEELRVLAPQVVKAKPKAKKSKAKAKAPDAEVPAQADEPATPA